LLLASESLNAVTRLGRFPRYQPAARHPEYLGNPAGETDTHVYTRKMRMVMMLTAVLIVSLLIFKGYSFGLGDNTEEVATPGQLDPVQRAKVVDPLIQETAEAQRKALEQQLK
jgi:hypothetical protein